MHSWNYIPCIPAGPSGIKSVKTTAIKRCASSYEHMDCGQRQISQHFSTTLAFDLLSLDWEPLFHKVRFGKAYPRNWAPEGPTSMSRLARPSPSTMGGIVARRCLFTKRQVTRVGALHFLGGMMMRRPLWRQPRMAPPLASTMKLTRKLEENKAFWPVNAFLLQSFQCWECRHQRMRVDCGGVLGKKNKKKNTPRQQKLSFDWCQYSQH